jgi:dTDP-4-dehydrorhamnose reductase
MKRILITGSNGLLGQKVVDIFSSGNYPLLLVSLEKESVFDEQIFPYRQADLTQKQDVRKIIDEFEPEIIVHTAAVTDVDLCEKDRALAWKVNVGSVENIAHSANLVGAKVIHLSTDYVFDGEHGPYGESDRTNPISYYGRTKLASENVLRIAGTTSTIIRTMVLYGIGHGVKQNFAIWLYQNLKEGKQIRVVDDQLGNPTFVDDLALAILKVVELERNGLYHIAGADIVSRYDFALSFAKIFGFNKKLIQPVKSSQFKQPAPRPLKSGLITLKAEIELGLKMAGVERGLTILKNQIELLFGKDEKNKS